MNDAQIFQLAGIPLFVMGLVWVIRPQSLKQVIRDMATNKGALLLAGISAFIIGYLIVAFHNVWSGGSAVIITIIGWLALLKGLFITVAASANVNLYGFMGKIRKFFVVLPWLVLIVGVVALYFGYFA